MKILYVLQGLYKGGAERLCLEIAQEINRNHSSQVLIIALNDEINEYPTLTNGLDIVCLDNFISLSVYRRNRLNIKEYEKIVDEFKPDIIHSNTYKAELVSRENFRFGIKYFTHCHSNMPEFESFNWKTLLRKKLLTNYFEKKRIEKKYLQCDNQFIAISKDTYEFYSKNLDFDLKKNIHFLPNAIDFQKFYNPEKKFISERLNLIMVGHMSDYKNQIFLIEVLSILRNKNIPAYLTLIGDWRSNGLKIEAKAKEQGVYSFLHMPGMVENVEDYYKDQQVYVHSSITESFGLVLIEAMASGLPIVCLDGGGNRDIIEEGKNGYMIYTENAEMFTDKIISLWENQEKYLQMSNYAKEYAKKFDIKEYVDKLLKIYEDRMMS